MQKAKNLIPQKVKCWKDFVRKNNITIKLGNYCVRCQNLWIFWLGIKFWSIDWNQELKQAVIFFFFGSVFSSFDYGVWVQKKKKWTGALAPKENRAFSF